MSQSWFTKLKIPRGFFPQAGSTMDLDGELVKVVQDPDPNCSAIALEDSDGKYLWVYFTFKAGDDGFVSMFDRTSSNMGSEWMVPVIKKLFKKSQRVSNV